MLRVIRAANASPMTLDGTRTFLVGQKHPVVIDPGPDDAGHLRAIESALDGARPAAILLTHAHADHAAGAPALAHRTGAPLWLARGASEAPLPASQVGRWTEDGDEVWSDAGQVHAVATPGHAPEHMAFWWDGNGGTRPRVLLAGDLFMGVGDTALVASPEGDLAAYLRSLDRVEELGPAILYPAHGPPLTDPQAVIRRYRDHRLGRIRQVVDALRDAPDAELSELVEAVYGPGLHPGLRGAAEGSLRAILEYLREAESS